MEISSLPSIFSRADIPRRVEQTASVTRKETVSLQTASVVKQNGTASTGGLQILNSDVQMISASAVSASREENITLRVDLRPLQKNTQPPAAQTSTASTTQTDSSTNAPDPSDSKEYEKLLILKAVLEKLTGRKIQVLDPKDLRPDGNAKPLPALEQPPPEGAQSAPRAADPGFSVDFTKEDVQTESENTQFEAVGIVQPTDGREITFRLEFAISRDTEERNTLHAVAGRDATDPLVIAFGDKPATLSGASADFDLDADGNPERIAFVDGNGGILALDRNGDGKITNGSELFGPSTGNAYAELASLDSDKNGWIDSGDPDYKNLQVWTRDAAGKDVFSPLSEKGVGAISLQNLAAPFQFQDAAGKSLGDLRAAGVYLTNTGKAGLVEQMDLATMDVTA